MTTTTEIFDTLWAAPASDRGWLRINRDGSVEQVGQEHAKTTVLSATNTPGLGTVLVLHEEGRSYWAGRPPSKRGYAPATVFSVLVQPVDRGALKYVKLTARAEVGNAAERLATSNRITTALAAQEG